MTNQSLFSNENENVLKSELHEIVATTRSAIQHSATGGVIATEHANIALESAAFGRKVDEATRADISASFENLRNQLLQRSVATENADVSRVARSARAGAGAAIVAQGFAKLQNVNPASVALEQAARIGATGAQVVTNYMGKNPTTSRIATEAYDDSEIRNAVVSSTALNYAATRQNEFGEGFFPSVILAPDQFSFHAYLSQVNVMKEVRREISGRFNRYFNRVNLLRAVIDHTLLDMHDNDVVPVVVDENKHLFVDESDFAPYETVVEDSVVKTSAIKFGIPAFDLLGVSQREAIRRSGVLDHTDALDPALSLKTLLLKVGDNVIRLGNLNYLTSSNFVPTPQGDSRQMQILFNTGNYPLSPETTKADGSDLVGDLAKLKANGYTVRVKMSVTGEVNLQDAGTALNANAVMVTSITDKDGNEVDITAGEGKALVDAINAGKLIGYELNARLVNSNKRIRGRLLDMSSYSILYTVPLLGPISTNRPLKVGDEHNEEDLAALITAVRFYCSTKAVTALFDVKDLLAQYSKDKAIGADIDTEYLGIARRLITPHFESSVLNVKDVVASLKSEDRPLQVQAVLVNRIRDMVYRAWYVSGIQVAADAIFAGNAPVPTVVIGCDPYVARYLQIQGDLRTIGGAFELKVVSSMDDRMKGQMFIAFQYETADAENGYHPLNFGMMLWKPEVVIAAPIYRNGQTSRELTVQPSFLHVVNCPVLMHLEIQGIEAAAVDAAPLPVLVAKVPEATAQKAQGAAAQTANQGGKTNAGNQNQAGKP